MEENSIDNFIGKYREQFDREGIYFSCHLVRLKDLQKIISLYFENDIAEKDLVDFAWNLIFDDKYSYSDKEQEEMSDLLFNIDMLGECRDESSRNQITQELKKLSLNIL